MPSIPDRLPRALLVDEALPLYGRTAARILAELRDTGALPGDRLPSERLLSERYDVSRVTLRAALAELAARGIVASTASRGWFVGDAAPAPPSPLGEGPTVQGFADFARRHGSTIAAQVRSVQVRASTHDEASSLRMTPGAPLFDLHRLRFLDGLVVVAERNRIPLALCPSLADQDFSTASLYETLRAGSPPQLPTSADYSVEARTPSAEEAELLEMDEPVPLLVARQLTFNQDGRPLELTVATYRGDRYQFTATITNTRGR